VLARDIKCRFRDMVGGVRYFNEIPYFVAIYDRQPAFYGRIRREDRGVLSGSDEGPGSASCFLAARQNQKAKSRRAKSREQRA
jgi:hypothetical protein